MGGAAFLKLLLDTHIWLWSLLEPDRLGRRATRELASSNNELWLSPISLWEVLVLAEKGRLILDRPTEVWIDEALANAPMREAPITCEIARQSRAVRLSHQDPADRFLAATAKVLGLTLVTVDDRLLRSPDYEVLSGR